MGVEDRSEVKEWRGVRDRSEVNDWSGVGDRRKVKDWKSVGDRSEVKECRVVEDRSEANNLKGIEDSSEVKSWSGTERHTSSRSVAEIRSPCVNAVTAPTFLSTKPLQPETSAGVPNMETTKNAIYSKASTNLLKESHTPNFIQSIVNVSVHQGIKVCESNPANVNENHVQ